MLFPQQSIGILGGMGPNASADFLQRILRLAGKRGAVQDDEYPTILLNSIGLQGFSVSGVTDTPLVETQLISGVRTLQSAGANLIAIPCNTVHCFYQSMQRSISIPLLNIADITAAAVATAGISTVGLCSSCTTVQTGLYKTACSQYGVDIVIPSAGEQQTVNTIIEAVMSGVTGDEELVQLKSIILSLNRKGAQGVILGCTELPLVINQKWTDVQLFDSLELLAEEAINMAYETFVHHSTP